MFWTHKMYVEPSPPSKFGHSFLLPKAGHDRRMRSRENTSGKELWICSFGKRRSSMRYRVNRSTNCIASTNTFKGALALIPRKRKERANRLGETIKGSSWKKTGRLQLKRLNGKSYKNKRTLRWTTIGLLHPAPGTVDIMCKLKRISVEPSNMALLWRFQELTRDRFMDRALRLLQEYQMSDVAWRGSIVRLGETTILKSP